MCVCVCVCVCVRARVCVHSVTEWCWSLCHAMDNSPPGSSVHWMSQARILEWIAISSSRGSSWPRDQTCISCVYSVGKWILHHCTTREAQSMPSSNIWKTQLPFPWGIRKMSSNLCLFSGFYEKWYLNIHNSIFSISTTLIKKHAVVHGVTKSRTRLSNWTELKINFMSKRHMWGQQILLPHICKLCMHAKSLQSCLTLCHPMDRSPPGSCPWDSPGMCTGVGCHALLQGSSWHRDWTRISYVSWISRHVPYPSLSHCPALTTND